MTKGAPFDPTYRSGSMSSAGRREQRQVLNARQHAFARKAELIERGEVEPGFKHALWQPPNSWWLIERMQPDIVTRSPVFGLPYAILWFDDAAGRRQVIKQITVPVHGYDFAADQQHPDEKEPDADDDT